jgi:hypothetical protein
MTWKEYRTSGSHRFRQEYQQSVWSFSASINIPLIIPTSCMMGDSALVRAKFKRNQFDNEAATRQNVLNHEGTYLNCNCRPTMPDIRRSSNEGMEEEIEETARLRERKWLNDRGAQLSSVTSHSFPFSPKCSCTYLQTALRPHPRCKDRGQMEESVCISGSRLTAV